MKEITHLGMKIEGMAGKGRDRNLVLARNLTSGRAWVLDTETGIGEPIPVDPPIRAATPEERPEIPKQGGPHRCDWCGERKLFVIRFSLTEYITKCLACRRFVVDGREERPARTPRVSRSRDSRQQTLSFSRPPSTKATGS